MRLAILADIHANLQALEAVLADARENACTEFLCLGDVVGYNANPSECLEIIRSLPGACVLGNHDQAAASEDSLEGMSAHAAASIAWTRLRLDAGQREWLGSLRPQRQIRRITLVHATLDSPLSWGYVRTAADAAMSLACQRTPLCFIGHTHVPGAFGDGIGQVLLTEGEGISLPESTKMLINPGSVGQPRDGDPRASYMIHDEEDSGLWHRRVEYDTAAAASAVLAAGLPERLAERLRAGA